MTSIDPSKDYQAYIETLPFDELLRVQRTIDRSQFPDRYQMVNALIEKHRNENTIQYSQVYLDRLRYPHGVRFIRGANALVLCIGLVGLVYKIGKGAIHFTPVSTFLLAYGLVLSAAIVYGLYRERPWVVIVILLNSSLQIPWLVIDTFMDFGAPSHRVTHLSVRLVAILFHAFQIIVFSRSDTRRFFKDKGVVLVAQ